MFSLFGRKAVAATTSTPTTPPEDDRLPFNLLVIDSDKHNWKEIFLNKRTPDGRRYLIVTCLWENMTVTCDSGSNPVVNIRSATGGGSQFIPDMVLVRKLVRGLRDDEDYSNALFGLMYSNIPAVNSLESVYRALERPLVYAELAKIRDRLGAKVFPLIPQSYYSHPRGMMFTPELPLVVKVGYAQAGYGKMKFTSQSDLTDFRGCLELHKDYVTAEPFIEGRLYDLRIQKIGTHLRVYKRINPNWKGNVGSSILEEIPVTDQYRLWAEECGKLFGGMDILTVDAIRTPDGKEFILEINDCASGLAPVNEHEDMEHIAEVITNKLLGLCFPCPNATCADSPKPPPTTTATTPTSSS
ncbi:synapsin II [Pelomyxa schiedti]|nr:synapsin II [Pelomyxa schiedti]